MRSNFFVVIVIATLLLINGCSRLATIETPRAASVLSGWPETSTEVATTVIDKYGAPDEVTPTMLVWRNNGPWKRTIVYRDTVAHLFPMPHGDLLEQFINYRVPTEMFDELANYDGSVIVERTKGEISARCDKEGANFLALNLADDIANGRRTVEEARRFYSEAIQEFMGGGQPDYMQGFQFTVPRGGTEDPDSPTISTGG